MSDDVTDWWKHDRKPTDVDDALRLAMRTWPGDKPGCIQLFRDLIDVARKKGWSFSLGRAKEAAAPIAAAIRAYNDALRYPSMEPKKREEWLREARSLARELAKVLRSPHGQPRFAHILENAYADDELSTLYLSDLNSNVLLTLLDEIATIGPMSASAAANFPYSESSKVRQAWLATWTDKTSGLRSARDEPEVQAIDKKRRQIFSKLKLPRTRDPIRRKLMSSIIFELSKAMGVDAWRSLVSGQGRPYAILQDMTALVLEYVGKHPGAPSFEVGQETIEFRHSLRLASAHAQDQELMVTGMKIGLDIMLNRRSD